MQVNGDKGAWGAVCGPITSVEATTVCRGLGWWYGGAVLDSSYYVPRPPGTPTVAGGISCNATAPSLAACTYATDAKATTCSPYQARFG